MPPPPATAKCAQETDSKRFPEADGAFRVNDPEGRTNDTRKPFPRPEMWAASVWAGVRPFFGVAPPHPPVIIN